MSKLLIKTRLILLDKEQILLLKRTKYKGGKFTFVGGKVEKDEFAKAALIRESKEEANITIEEKDLRLIHVLHKIDDESNRVILYFKATNWEGAPVSKEPHKFKSAEWHKFSNLPKGLSDTAFHVVKMIRKGCLYSEFRKTSAPKENEPLPPTPPLPNGSLF